MRNSTIIELAKLIDDGFAFGNEQGQAAYQKLAKEVNKHPSEMIFGISLKGIKATDASFPRESVISLIKSKNGEKGFYLLDFATQDLMDNWSYAAKAKDQPVIVLHKAGYYIIGPDLPAGSKELLDYIMKEGKVTTSKVASTFEISAQNASAKLKKLFSRGLILGTKGFAASGGMEFIYQAIK